MRGKAIDTEFVAEFVQECASKDKTSPEEICNEAISKIEEIDKQLKIRIKLNDILSFFKYKKKLINENCYTSFDSINKKISKEIIEFITTTNCEEKFIIDFLKIKKRDYICVYKQLLKNKVIEKSNSSNEEKIIGGKNFETFKSKFK